MEMNYMLAYGSAEASLRLLWRFGLLEHLLPFQVNSWTGKQTYLENQVFVEFFVIVLTK
jgi:tRNA nucleotidyltransferase/poly(A) polymerase